MNLWDWGQFGRGKACRKVSSYSLPGTALVLALFFPCVCAARCRETPTVLLDERAAETHLLAKKEPEVPASMPRLAGVQEVVMLLTVDRRGVICEVKPVTGPRALRRAAVEAVKKHWRYRPFLVDWKPVVARFPVTASFVVRKVEPWMTAESRALLQSTPER